ncbi:hypothetical protein PHYSODRAFT_325627 [Phytophthora sojae]|uniref:Peptidase A2 domain-containing protein n=1 Tax=Phytophthora sojae (strain P6497) TaxID=1094619 RepID=G4YXM8_PHYSP|nr:hypothetical protein PHYSODRAFT_325627 [Phytophthora sojae]EGZ24517.1 hypothetical protein PHYSODRAFT_325627 [Phytophthora sojae]|eukprot:XP_009519805.1 hypothetical protein PHYSODRAFT_325627 [Phytophthora sojae]
MAKGVKSAVPATPVKPSGTRNEASVRSGSSFSTPATDRMESIDERSARCDTAIDSSDAKEDDEDDDWDVRTVMSETSKAAVVSAGRSGGSRLITRDLSETFNDMPGPEPACDADDGATEGFKASVTVLGRCLELMKAKSEWMQLFSPKQIRALATPINSTSTRQVAQNTVDLLRAMGCEPQILPTEAALASWTPTTAAKALTKWRKKLREAFGVADRGSTKLRSAPGAVDPSKVPLPATLRKAATDDEVVAVKGEASPYMQDSHMVTPRSTDRSERLTRETEVSYATPGTRGATGRRSSRRYDLRDDSSDSDDDLGSDCYEGDLPSEWARQVRELSATDNQSSTPTLEITTHLPLCNINSFYGVRDKSEHSMQWLRTFVYEMRLPRKTRRTWKLLCEAFIKYYCSKFSQSAKTRYYSIKRENKEHICDYLNRLNGYARNAGVQFEHGDRDAKDHVEHFLVTCDDRNLEDRLCHVRVKSIHDLEDMINDILRHRDRKSTRESSFRRSRSQDDSRRRDARSNEDSRSGYRCERRYRDEDRRERRYRGDDRLTDRRDDDRRRDRRDGSPHRSRVTLVDALPDGMAEWNIGGSANKDYFDDERQYSDDQRSDEDSDADYDSDESTRHVAAANDAERRAAADGTFARSDNRRYRNGGGPSNRKRDGRRQFGPCAACRSPSHSVHFCYRRCQLCKQVHDAGKCEALHELTKLLKSKVDKKDLSPELQSLLAEPAVDADYLFAFTGESRRPDDRKNNERVKLTGNGENRDASLVEIGIDEDDDDERDGRPTEALITSLAQIRGPPRSLVRAVKLLPGERPGWWSSQRYDKRKRMRALVNGAVDDARTRILLDTGANVSVISASFAKRLRVREVRGHGQSLEVRGINPGVIKTRRRALVKITLGWEQAYEFEMWIMDHSAGVDVVLGMDFMIPARIRLDLFHGTARLPDEVMVPLLKSQSVGDDEPYGTQPSSGPTEDLYVPGREWREFRLPRQRLSRSEYDVWVRCTDKLVPTVTRLRRVQPTRVRLTNITTTTAQCAKHDSVVLWVPHGELPRETGYARLGSNKYNEWQVLAYSTSRDETLYGRERCLYDQLMAKQPPAVERRIYSTPQKILRRPLGAPTWPRGHLQGRPNDDYSSLGISDHDNDLRVSQGSVKVTEPGADAKERDGISNDGLDDEAIARTDSDALEWSSLHRAAYASKRTDHNADSIEHGAQKAPAEVSGAGDKRDDGVGELNDDSGEDHDAPDVTAAVEPAPRMAGTATDTQARLEPDQTSVAWGNATIDWGEHDPGPNDILTEAGTATTEVKGFTEDDDTANEIKLSDYAQESLPTPRLKPTTRIWPTWNEVNQGTSVDSQWWADRGLEVKRT